MLEEALLLGVCSLIALAGLAVFLWEAASGRLFSIDSLTLTLISLTLAVVFGGNVAWSIHTGDVQRILNHLGKHRVENEATEKDS